MMKLSREDLYSLEKYAEVRPEFRAKVIAHKKDRRLPIGPNAALYFEDRLTMQYQIQEMLRIERIFEAAAIQEELEVYNPLIPDGSNWKATFMMEYSDVEQRRVALARLVGIEETLWVEVEGHEKVYPIANEDLDRSSDEKTASVHFLRFELTDKMVADLKAGLPLLAGIEHKNYHHTTVVADNVRQALIGDLQ
ncbi:DUF3501 family protein [Ectothiorhodospiraceae bacterium BW-2]|nr:DUF3501 family protein [Ectothiorhodospiraceae bacterium BW-2]